MERIITKSRTDKVLIKYIKNIQFIDIFEKFIMNNKITPEISSSIINKYLEFNSGKRIDHNDPLLKKIFNKIDKSHTIEFINQLLSNYDVNLYDIIIHHVKYDFHIDYFIDMLNLDLKNYVSFRFDKNNTKIDSMHMREAIFDIIYSIQNNIDILYTKDTFVSSKFLHLRGLVTVKNSLHLLYLFKNDKILILNDEYINYFNDVYDELVDVVSKTVFSSKEDYYDKTTHAYTYISILMYCIPDLFYYFISKINNNDIDKRNIDTALIESNLIKLHKYLNDKNLSKFKIRGNMIRDFSSIFDFKVEG